MIFTRKSILLLGLLGLAIVIYRALMPIKPLPLRTASIQNKISNTCAKMMTPARNSTEPSLTAKELLFLSMDQLGGEDDYDSRSIRMLCINGDIENTKLYLENHYKPTNHAFQNILADYVIVAAGPVWGENQNKTISSVFQEDLGSDIVANLDSIVPQSTVYVNNKNTITIVFPNRQAMGVYNAQYTIYNIHFEQKEKIIL